MPVIKRIVGILLALALIWAAMWLLDNYAQLANVARWSGNKELGWLRGWFTEFRMPILCVVGFLGLTVVSWIWSKLRLGH